MQGDSVFVSISFVPIEHMRYSAIVPVFLDGNFAKVIKATCLSVQHACSVHPHVIQLSDSSVLAMKLHEDDPAYMYFIRAWLMQSYLDIRVEGEGQDPSLRFGVRECILPAVRCSTANSLFPLQQLCTCT